MKKYNNQTGGYKIDLFMDGKYLCSTDWSKTLKAAKQRYADKHFKGVIPAKLKAYFG